MAVSFSQPTVGYFGYNASQAIPTISVTVATGDIVIILEGGGRPSTTELPTWLVDSSPITATHIVEGSSNTMYTYVVQGLATGGHAIDSVNGTGSGWTSARGRVYGVVVVSGADPVSLGDIFMYLSGGSSSSIMWSAANIPANGAALMLGVSRYHGAVVSSSHTALGDINTGDGQVKSYSAGALQSYVTAIADASEDMTVTFTSDGGRAYAGIVFAPSTGVVGDDVINKLRHDGEAPNKLMFEGVQTNRVYHGSDIVYGYSDD